MTRISAYQMDFGKIAGNGNILTTYVNICDTQQN